MATDQQSGRYTQPIVNGQSSDSPLSSSYGTGKTVYSSESVRKFSISLFSSIYYLLKAFGLIFKRNDIFLKAKPNV